MLEVYCVCVQVFCGLRNGKLISIKIDLSCYKQCKVCVCVCVCVECACVDCNCSGEIVGSSLASENNSDYI